MDRWPESCNPTIAGRLQLGSADDGAFCSHKTQPLQRFFLIPLRRPMEPALEGKLEAFAASAERTLVLVQTTPAQRRFDHAARACSRGQCHCLVYRHHRNNTRVGTDR